MKVSDTVVKWSKDSGWDATKSLDKITHLISKSTTQEEIANACKAFNDIMIALSIIEQFEINQANKF